MKIPISKKRLKKLYFYQKLSFREIGDIFNCDRVTISNRFKEFKLKPRTISESLKGRKITWAYKIGDALRGRKRPSVGGRKKGCEAWNRGLRKHSSPNKIKYGVSGKNHWNWKGGISPLNARERQSSRYKEWRTKIFKRDNYICQTCSKRGGELNAHHKKGFTEYKLLRYDMRNGITLCTSCHKKIHFNKRSDKI